MKISELRATLVQIELEHGDIEVVAEVYDPSFGDPDWQKVRSGWVEVAELYEHCAGKGGYVEPLVSSLADRPYDGIGDLVKVVKL